MWGLGWPNIKLVRQREVTGKEQRVLGWDTVLNRVDKEHLTEKPSQKLLAEHRR